MISNIVTTSVELYHRPPSSPYPKKKGGGGGIGTYTKAKENLKNHEKKQNIYKESPFLLYKRTI